MKLPACPCFLCKMASQFCGTGALPPETRSTQRTCCVDSYWTALFQDKQSEDKKAVLMAMTDVVLFLCFSGCHGATKSAQHPNIDS